METPIGGIMIILILLQIQFINFVLIMLNFRRILIILISLLLFFNLANARQKNYKKHKTSESVDYIHIEPDPIPSNATPDKISKGLLLPSISFSTQSIYIHGFDISHHQGDVDWIEVAKDPNAGYIFLKATEGANFIDRNYRRNFREAKIAGLKVGSYHFFRPNVSGEVQYRHFINTFQQFIFLKYISDRFEAKYQELVAEGYGMEEDKDEYISENIFYVPQKARWSVIAENAHKPEIGIVIDEDASYRE